MGHSCGTLCRTLLWDTLVGHSSYETSSKSHMSSLQNERFVRDFLQKSSMNTHPSTHITQPCQAVSRTSTRLTRTKVLRLPRNVTSVTPRSLTIPCACHENRTSTPQKPHKVLRLPRKVTISSHVSFIDKICIAPHVWNEFDPF